MPDTSPPRIALLGVNRFALDLGRACALRDEPVLGIWDPDRSLSLRASLYLGVSSFDELEELWSLRPTLAFCSSYPDKPPSGVTLVSLASTRPASISLNLEFQNEIHRDLPEAISSEIPPYQAQLHGTEGEPKDALREFLASTYPLLEILES